MVYPGDFLASEHGRDILDSNNPAPFVITAIRQKTDDHIQPVFSNPEQVRSAFISEVRPEINNQPLVKLRIDGEQYATSTMSDPQDWRPRNQIEVIEERLLRIRQWAESASTISNLNETDRSGRIVIRQIDCMNDVEKNISCSLLSTENEHLMTSDNNDKTIFDKRENEIRFIKEGLEKLFNLDVKDDDTNFVSNLKTNLKKKLSNYIKDKADKISSVNLSTFSEDRENLTVDTVNFSISPEDMEKLSEIFNTTINEIDDEICGKVHALCLKLQDTIILKDGITTNKFDMNELKLTELRSDSSNLSSLPDSEINTNKKPFESEKQFSENNSSTSQHDKKLHKKTIDSKRFIKPNKHDNTNHNASTLIIDSMKNLKSKSKKLSKSLHKEEIVKKAKELGLLDSGKKIAKVPQLTERAQLALLEKQIQGRIKIKQLQRKNTDQRERINVYKENGRQNNANALMKSKSKENLLTVQVVEATKESNIISNENESADSIKSSEIKENSFTDAELVELTNSTSSTIESTSFLMPQYLNEFNNIVEEEIILRNITINNENHEKKKDKEIITSFIASKEKLDDWENISESEHTESCVNVRLLSETRRFSSLWIKFLFSMIVILFFVKLILTIH